MEYLVSLLQATEYGNRILHCGLFHHDGLETTLKSGILLDILTVLIERSRTDTVQFASSQHGLQKVARIHSTLRLSCPDNRMQFIDKEQDPAVRAFHLIQHGFQTFLKFTLILSARNQGAHIERKYGLILQAIWHIASYDTLGQPLRDGRLTYTWLTNQYRVVLSLTRKNSDDIPNLRISTYDGIQFMLSCGLDQILAIFLQRLVGLLRRIARHTGIPPHVRQDLQKRILRDGIILEDILYRVISAVQQRKE